MRKRSDLLFPPTQFLSLMVASMGRYGVKVGIMVVHTKANTNLTKVKSTPITIATAGTIVFTFLWFHTTSRVAAETLLRSGTWNYTGPDIFPIHRLNYWLVCNESQCC